MQPCRPVGQKSKTNKNNTNQPFSPSTVKKGRVLCAELRLVNHGEARRMIG